MQDPTDNLTPKQVKALTALLAGKSVEAAAKEAGVNPATLHRWLGEVAFKAAYHASRRELAQQGLGVLQAAVRAAVGTVVQIMQSTTAPAAIRLRAAQIIIESAVKWLELEDLDARLHALEEKYAQNVR